MSPKAKKIVTRIVIGLIVLCVLLIGIGWVVKKSGSSVPQISMPEPTTESGPGFWQLLFNNPKGFYETYPVGTKITLAIVAISVLIMIWRTGKLGMLFAALIAVGAIAGIIYLRYWIPAQFPSRAVTSQEVTSTGSVTSISSKEEVIKVGLEYKAVTKKDWSWLKMAAEPGKPIIRYIPPNGIPTYNEDGTLKIDEVNGKLTIIYEYGHKDTVTDVKTTEVRIFGKDPVSGTYLFWLDPRSGATEGTVTISKVE